MGARLSKSRFVAGVQCHRRLWWQVAEPDAPELVPDDAQREVFARGHAVGDAARRFVPGGVLIDCERERAVEETRRALAGGAQRLYEAAFFADGVFVAVDILERSPHGWHLVEVKSTLDTHAHHVLDAAVQTHVVRRAGLPVHRTSILHLNRECRFPDLSNLFVRDDVSDAVEARLVDVPRQIRAQLRVLARSAPPPVTIGDHCDDPYECPFVARCWPAPVDHGVGELYRIGRKRLAQLERQGVATIFDVGPDVPLDAVARRQRDAVQRRQLVVEPGLGAALAGLGRPRAFLDFETVSLPIPVWDGCGPYHAVPAQFSCHVEANGRLDHHEWIATGPGDPREPLARALLDATRGAGAVLAWSASFERRCVDTLAAAVPSFADPLRALRDRIVDLLPIVRDHVYHPDFRGRFGLGSVLPALVPGAGWSDLAIDDGERASQILSHVVTGGGPRGGERERCLADLRAYCTRDTWALVKVVERLEGLTSGVAA